MMPKPVQSYGQQKPMIPMMPKPVQSYGQQKPMIPKPDKYGGVLHIYVDKVAPQGNVYVKCPTVNTAVAAVNTLHGRWFAGNVITAAYVPLVNYHNLFSDAAYAATPLVTTRRQ